MPLHPDLEAFLTMVNRADDSVRCMSAMTPTEARAAYERSISALDVPGPDVPTETLHIESRDGHRLSARLYRGDVATPSPVLLFFHGGGYVLGDLESHDSLCRSLAELTPCVVVAVDYRLAPEHKFPTAFEDAVDAGEWLRKEGARYGLDPGRIAFGGDSVGATLATVLTIALRNAGRAQPALQLLLYPCASARQDSESHRRFSAGYLLEHRNLQWMFGHYLRSDEDRGDWRFAPLEAPTLQGLAPAHVALAEYDPLIDEGRLYARRLADAGVPTALKVYSGMVHDFARLGNVTDEAGTLRRDLAEALGAAFL
jgi:acetyl esterase